MHRANTYTPRPLVTGLSLAVLFGLLIGPGCDDGGGGADQRRLADSDAMSFDASPPPDAAADAEPVVEEGPVINSLIPARGPIAGGTRVLIIGQGFVEGTAVNVGGLPCGDLVVENENHIRCVVPPGEVAGPIRVFARWPEGGVPFRLDDAFTYFEPLEVDTIAPDRAPLRGGVQVVIEGQGFVEPTGVRFGDIPARQVNVTDPTRLVVVAPENTPGFHDVVVSNLNGEITLPEAFAYTEPLSLQDLSPRWSFLAGGQQVTLHGAGLRVDSEVAFGDTPALVDESLLERARLLVEAPAAATPGLVDVRISNVNGARQLDGAFLYVDGDRQDFGVEAVVPQRVPSTGGTAFHVAGGGFTETTEVFVGGQAVPCELEAPQVLTCVTAPHPEGFVTVEVVDGARRDALARGLLFYTRVQVYDIQPARGSVAGGTVVEIIGEGFDERVQLSLDEEPMTRVEVLEPGRLRATTPRGRSGRATLRITNGLSEDILPEAFEYFDPTTRFGGVWGEPINGSVNVTVLNYFNSEPVNNATAMVQPHDPAPGGPEALYATTDFAGQATVSAPGLAGPLSITVAAPEYEATTFDRISSENVTIYLRPYEPPPPPEGGGGPQEPIPPGRLRGQITGMAQLEKPIDPDLVLAAFVDTTHTAQGNRQFLPWPEPEGILLDDGPFDVFCRPGELAVVVTAGYVPRAQLNAYLEGRIDYWSVRSRISPIAMGLQRFLSVSPGEGVEGLAIDLDIPLDVDVPVTMLRAPGGELGAPSRYEVQPYLDFGAEGYWQLDTAGFGDTPFLQVRHMPDVANQMDADVVVQWVGEARPPERIDDLPAPRFPYSIAFEETREVVGGLELGPFVSTPQPVLPADGQSLGPDRRLTWRLNRALDGPGEPPDATLVRIYSQAGRSLWLAVVPGGLNEITFPILPEAVRPSGLAEGEAMIITLVPFLSDGRFNYADFTYGDIGGAGQSSYSVNSYTFLP